MASGGEPKPPTGGRCGICACAKPAATKVISPPKMIARTDQADMLAAPRLYTRRYSVPAPHCASGATVLFRRKVDRCYRAALDRDVVDQACLSKPGRNQDSHWPVLRRGDRCERIGVPRLVIVEVEAGVRDQFSAAGHRSLDIVARTQTRGAFLHGAIQRWCLQPLFRGQIDVP